MRFVVPLLFVLVVLFALGADGGTVAAGGDIDSDGVPDATDNCPTVPNPDQSDTEADGIGDACDDDWDNDGVGNFLDSCNDTPLGEAVDQYGCSHAQLDPDGDGFCAAATEGQPTWCALPDNCEGIPNPGQDNADRDIVGDPCDNCTHFLNSWQSDGDSDGIGDTCDTCTLFGGVCARVLPLHHSSSDFMQLRLSGTYPDDCWDSSASHVQVDAYTIRVTLVFQISQGICGQLASDWGKAVDFGILPNGYYDVQVLMQAAGGPCGDICGGGFITIDRAGAGGDWDGDGEPNPTDADDDNDGFSDADEAGAPSAPTA
jgi:hypothetical protein